jgi:Gas vesicle protein G
VIFSGIIWLATKISEAVDTELTQRKEACMVELRQLHKSLETGNITEEEFDLKEAEILDTLDALENMSKPKDAI